MVEMSRFVRSRLSGMQKLKVLDVGSYDVNGSYRKLFQNPGWDYVGVDVSEGPNVDRAADAEKLPFADGEFDCVISGQMLEHVFRPWVIVPEMARVLAKNGTMCIIVPFRIFEHRYPVDCWRFLPDGLRYLMQDMAGLKIVECRISHDDTVGIARKE